MIKIQMYTLYWVKSHYVKINETVFKHHVKHNIIILNDTTQYNLYY